MIAALSSLICQNAQQTQSFAIADLILTAMGEECCRYFCGPHHSVEDFRQMMIHLVKMKCSQYSYCNTIVAMVDGQVTGIAVSYDGARLHSLRRAFLTNARRELQSDFSFMTDETSAGELYLDSLAVLSAFRRQGIGQQLLLATARKAAALHIPCVGLLVDILNPTAEKFYLANGFHFVDENVWGGHTMKHLQKKIMDDPGIIDDL